MSLKNSKTGESIEQEQIREQTLNPISERAEREIALRRIMKSVQEQTERLIEIQRSIENCSKQIGQLPTNKNDRETEDAARLAEIFDRYCKRIVDQHLIDARKQTNRLTGELERAAKRIGKRQRLQTFAYFCSAATFVLLLVIAALLWLR